MTEKEKRMGFRTTRKGELRLDYQKFARYVQKKLKLIYTENGEFWRYKNGVYKPIFHCVDNKKTVFVLAAAILKCSGQEYMTWEEIIHHPALFPFNIEHVTQADLAACDRFVLERMGDNVVIRFRT